MVGTKTLIYGAWGVWFCGIWISAATAAADDHPASPRSLRMRASASAGNHAASGKRVGQAAPADPPLDADAPAEASPPEAAPPDDGGEPIVAPGAVEVAAPAPAVAAPVATPAPVPPAVAVAPGPATSGDAADDPRGRRHHLPARFTVTGSLIERATLTTPSPLTILRRDELLGSGRSMIGDILQGLPEQGDALNAQNNNGGDGSTRVNLRALGIDRTLTLVNGRRFVPGGTGADTSVDLNTIPLAMIDRVEVLKDSGSAVYGSDAVGGVVNIITRDHFHGTEASLYTAQTERGDGFTFDASIITGHRTADGRGNIVFSAGTQRQEAVFAGDRDFSKVTRAFDFIDGTTVLTGSSSTPNGRLDASQTSAGRINACGAGITFCTSDGHGGFRPFILPTATSFGDNFNFQPDNLIYTPSARANAFTTGSYQLTPGVEGFFEASFMHRSSHQRLASTPLTTQLFGLVISRDSIYNPFGVDLRSLNRRLQEFGPREFQQSTDTMRTVVGLRGDAPSDVAALDGWKWELSFNYGRTDSTQKDLGNLVLSRVRNAIGPSFVSPTGPTCGTPSAPIAGCVPMNLLGGAGSISQAAVDYAGFTGLDLGLDKQLMALATAHGRIATLPGGGDISAAIIADARKDTGELTPDPLIASGDTTGAALSAVTGSVKAQEAAAELSIVPVRDHDGVERIELDLAARAFRYDTFGDGTSTTARALVRPVRGITLRASQSTSFRAPSVGELFAAKADAFPLAQDPCDHAFGTPDPATAAECAREGVAANAVFGTFQQHAITGGNPQVQPETAKVRTVGVVLESPRAKGLSLSLDWWNIDLTQAIQTPLIQDVFANCYQRGIRSFCDLIRRNPMLGGEIDTVDLRFGNSGGTSTSGVDAAVSFDHHVPGAGDVHARFELQQLQSYDLDTGSTVIHGLGVYDLGIHPKRQASLFAMWRHPHGAAAGFNFHFVDSFQECQNDDCNDATNPSRTVESYSKLDVFSSITFRQFGGETTLTVGVNNVFDRQPPVIFNGPAGNYDESAYDFLGRFAYARLTQAF